MRISLIVIGFLVAVVAGIAIDRFLLSGSQPDAQPAASTERKVEYWVAPMDPNYRRNKPGKSPMGMDLVPVYEDAQRIGGPGVVAIDPKVVSNLGVRTAPVKKGPLSRRVETVGYVGYDEDTFHQVSTRVEGWVEKLDVKSTGDPVTKGQSLFELYAPSLVNAQQEFLASLASRNKALQAASRERLKSMGVSSAQIRRLEETRTVRQRIRVTAAAGGVVARLGVREGAFVTPATDIMAIAALDRAWVTAEVFPRQAAWVEAGQSAVMFLDHLPGETRQGLVDYVYPELDPKTRTFKVRLRFDNEANVLRPNMLVRIRIEGVETDDVLYVPREAIIYGAAETRVVVALGNGTFRAQTVETGFESGGQVEICAGLELDDRIVTSGQFLIDSESSIDSALMRMDSGATP